MRACRPPRPSRPAPQAIAAEITARLAGLAFALPGTLADRMTRCGHPDCRCRADPPRLHGPYHQWTRKKNGKTATKILTDDQARRLRPLVRQPQAHPRAPHRTRSTQPRDRRGRPPLEPLTSQPARPAGQRNRNATLRITWPAPA